MKIYSKVIDGSYGPLQRPPSHMILPQLQALEQENDVALTGMGSLGVGRLRERLQHGLDLAEFSVPIAHSRSGLRGHLTARQREAQGPLGQADDVLEPAASLCRSCP
eukprot:scaffold647900_cov36-Prasinocladus_malaysianus.AAC.2